MVILGLFHGLIFLPVLLSLLGPDPYHSVSQEEEDLEENIPGWWVNKILIFLHKVKVKILPFSILPKTSVVIFTKEKTLQS